MLEVYQPLIKKWLRRFHAPENDLNDLSQSVLMVVTKKLPEFEHAGRVGSFRAWLRTITRNCLLKFWRENKVRPKATGDSEFQGQLNQLADDTSELSQIWNREYDEFVLAAVLRQIKPEFKPQTWTIFQRLTLSAEKPKVVADDLGVTLNTVFVAKSRVMSRLRVVGRHLID